MPDLSNWGQHGEIIANGKTYVQLTCRNHRNLRWSTKNIAPIGARNIFFDGSTENRNRWEVKECDCPCSDLIPVELSHD